MAKGIEVASYDPKKVNVIVGGRTITGSAADGVVSVTKNEDSIRLGSYHEFVASIDDISTSCSKVIAYGIHIDFRIFDFKVLEEHAIEVIVIVLTSMGKDNVKILTCLVNDSSKTDNLWTCANNNQQF